MNYIGDAIEVMSTMSKDQYGAVITSPPYNIGVDSCYAGPWPGGRGDSILEKDMSKFKVGDVVDGPVRVTTVVKKEIVPGVYGLVQVFGSGNISTELITDKSELAETIKTLQLIHDAME